MIGELFLVLARRVDAGVALFYFKEAPRSQRRKEPPRWQQTSYSGHC